MKTNIRDFTTSAFAPAVLLLLCVSSAYAQTPGYVSGLTGIEVFDSVTGQLLNTFSNGNIQGTLAVSKDGTTLFTAAVSDVVSPDSLESISASSGQVLSQIPGLTAGAQRTILGPTGKYAFAMCTFGAAGSNSISIINLPDQAVTGYLYVSGGIPVDIAISPNGKQLYVSTALLGQDGLPGSSISGAAGLAGTKRPIYKCPAPGTCVFDTSNFALIGISSVSDGYLAISEDGQSLYSLSRVNQLLQVINTTTLVGTRIGIPAGDLVFGVAVRPLGNQAVVGLASATAFSYGVLDTTTNQFTASLPGPPVSFLRSGSNVVAFSRDGSSLWSLGACEAVCTVLTGQSFPSGDIIAQTSLGENADALGISF